MKGAAVLLLWAVTLVRGAVIKRIQCQDGEDLIPHENCKQFYQCSGDQLIIMDCPGTLLFNPEIKQCDWPENVNCDYESSDSNESNSDNDDDDTPADDLAKICAQGGFEGALFPHEICNQFYMCANGKLVEFSCHPSLYFNPKTGECDWPYNVNCDSSGSEEDDGNGSEDNESNEDIDSNEDNDSDDGSDSDEGNDSDESKDSDEDNDSDEDSDSVEDADSDEGNDSDEDNNSDEDTNINPDCDEDTDCDNDDINEASLICAAEDSDGILIPHKICHLFYKCSKGKPVVMRCPPKLLYNIDTEQCDWPSAVECGDRINLVKLFSVESQVHVTVRLKHLKPKESDSTPKNNLKAAEN